MTAPTVRCPICQSLALRRHCDSPTCDLVTCKGCGSTGQPHPEGRWIDRSKAA